MPMSLEWLVAATVVKKELVLQISGFCTLIADDSFSLLRDNHRNREPVLQSQWLGWFPGDLKELHLVFCLVGFSPLFHFGRQTFMIWTFRSNHI